MLHVLLVEDNQDHAELIMQALEDSPEKEIKWLKDGQAAIDFFQQKNWVPDTPRLSLVLLDMNLPKVNGLAVLEAIRKEKSMETVPVVIFSSSDRDKEILQAYQLGANSYVTKPVKFEAYCEKIQSLANYWLNTNQLPSMHGE